MNGGHVTLIQAIFRDGVFQPTDPVNIAEGQRVRLSIEAVNLQLPLEWLDKLTPLHASIMERQGCLPDSAPDIAKNRTG